MMANVSLDIINKLLNLKIKYTPANITVDDCIKATAGIGANVVSTNQDCIGKRADLLIAPKNSINVIQNIISESIAKLS